MVMTLAFAQSIMSCCRGVLLKGEKDRYLVVIDFLTSSLVGTFFLDDNIRLIINTEAAQLPTPSVRLPDSEIPEH